MKKISDNLLKISKLLNDQQFHDGTSIGDKLSITRAAVWKVIKKLEAYGIPITSVKGKGYSLNEPLDLIDPKKIKSLLKSKSVQIDVFEQLDSTNDYLIKLAKENNKPTVCISEMQTNGKGRMNRQWHSPFGKNIYLSMLYPLQKDISELSGLSLIVGLAACDAIEETCDLTETLSVKWPNDIVANKKKLAGSLIEIQAESNGFCNAIIGIGLNVNMQDASKIDINQSWTSTRDLTANHFDRNIICASLINHLSAYLKRFEEHGLKDFSKEWKKRDYLLGKTVRLKSAHKAFSGKAAGINNDGHLLIELSDGRKQAFSSGDTTLLK